MAAHPPILTRAPRPTRAIDRPRLLPDESTGGVLLLGPAGAGKTILAAQIAGRPGRRVAWARLAPGHGRAVDLVELATRSATGATVDAAGRPLLDLAGDLLALADEEPTVIVVDDYDHAEGETCDPLLAEVVPLVPPGSHVVVCSRRRPAGLIGRLASGLRVVAADALAFTEEEAVAFLAGAGVEAGDAIAARERVGGWALGLALVAEAGGEAGPAADALVRRVLLDDATPDERALVSALAVLPYLSAPMVDGLGLERGALELLTQRTSLVNDDAGFVRMQPFARDVLAPLVAPADAAGFHRRAAPILEASDPAAAVDSLLAADDFEGAADTLARHLSTMDPGRALGWLYRLPSEVRRRFPPVLAAGRATVNIDEAVAAAEERVESAAGERERREALFALGSAHAHGGALSSAAAALERVVAGVARDLLHDRAATWLGIVRWWAGDLVGASAALNGAGESALAHWARAEVALAAGDRETAAAHAERSRAAAAGAGDASDATDAPATALLARLARHAGDREGAVALAAAAYRTASEADGFDLAAAAPTFASLLVEQGDFDEALAVADLVHRRIGRHDAYAKLQVHLVRAAVAASRHDRAAAVTAERSLALIRQGGFALVEAQAKALLPPLAPVDGPALRVDVLGPAAVAVRGTVLPRAAWKSLKALEVLQYLALRGDRGAEREEVIEAVWPDRDPEKGRMLLRAALSEIRRRLEPGRPAGEASEFVHTEGTRVRVSATTDLAEARALARDGQPAVALSRFRGELLADLPYAEWAFDDRRAAGALRCELAERVAGDESAGVEDRAAAYEVLIEAEPWRSEHYDRLAALHRRAGDEPAARAAERRRDAE